MSVQVLTCIQFMQLVCDLVYAPTVEHSQQLQVVITITLPKLQFKHILESHKWLQSYAVVCGSFQSNQSCISFVV